MRCESILEKAKEVMLPKLPEGTKFKDGECVGRIRVLEAFRTSDDALLAAFLEELAQRPQVYLEVQTPQQAAVKPLRVGPLRSEADMAAITRERTDEKKSSAPQNAIPDEAMIAEL